MTTSGTTSFNPSLGDAVIHAFGMCGVRPTAILQEHMVSARFAANMLQTTWSAKGVNLWKVTLQTLALVQGQAGYSVPTNNIVMLDAYISTVNGTYTSDRVILPVSRTEYSSYTNKAQQGFPSVYWQDRLLSGEVFLWPVPDGTQTSISWYQVEQIDDVSFTGGQTMDIPPYFQEAFVLGLAYRLAVSWSPERAVVLKGLADEAYTSAAEQNIERSDVFITPQIGGYWRN